ncbi:salivary gland secretion 1-PA [Microsporum canis CBS 113480]|uniref:Salivary gland secretion 1-PA n=1 Tax=Arthroderma otae (strain ATCC MYA-4605 / CBS 113480) TaxID=554155 RepID=C5FTA0_ARTOC|nr:salivary gland secretion 1-PA [Microsporum canis CBS 113480]EEQ33103.1 salivary gland secretion 1-PA [Microsporum canis CBS 113480]
MATAAADKSPKEPREKDSRDKESRDVTESETASNATTPAPYSTRSRNRVGARINYAEDNTELDAELDQPMPPASTNAGSSTRGTPGRKPRDRDAAAQTTSGNISSSNSNNHSSSNSNNHNSSNSNEKPPGMSTRRAAAAAAVNGAAAKDGKDTAIPGTSSFSANPNPAVVSKKRKQPGASTTVQNVVPANGGGQAGKRFIAAGSRNSEESATTSMMTFRHSKAMLKNGKLKADDGTLLAPNGVSLLLTYNILLYTD